MRWHWRLERPSRTSRTRDWAEELRGTYRGRVIGANLEAADAAMIAHDYQAGLGHAQAAARLDPFSERAHRTEGSRYTRWAARTKR